MKTNSEGMTLGTAVVRVSSTKVFWDGEEGGEYEGEDEEEEEEGEEGAAAVALPQA